jgi:4-oxalmesaconate hydratase
LIIDVHAHFTTAPPPEETSSDALAASLEPVIRQMDERGIDVLLFSPRAAGMGHDTEESRSRAWTAFSNDRIALACAIHPSRLAAVGQLPQAPGVPATRLTAELERCAAMGFAGCVINPDISGGGEPFTPSLGDRSWYPLWERLVDLRMPAMIHASASRNPAMQLHGSQYIAQDHAAVVELASSSVFDDFPELRLIVPHGGGGVPFQLGRLRALHVLRGLPPFEGAVRRIHFDTAVYDQAAMNLLVDGMGPGNLVFGSEMFGTAKAVDPMTGRPFDDILPLLRSVPGLEPEALTMILEGNARRLFPRAAAALAAREAEVAA